MTCGILAGFLSACVNYDRIAVFVLRAINAPVYEEARLVTGLGSGSFISRA